MSRKEKFDVELEQLRKQLHKQLGADKATGTFVTFDKRHMQLDVKGFLKSKDGASSLKKIITLSNRIPKKTVAAG